MKIYRCMDELIGHTPLLGLERLAPGVIAKLEYLNPAGSVKDRVARTRRNGGC